MNSCRAHSIQQKFWFGISDISRAQWNGADPSHRAIGYCSYKQDTKERYRGQQFCHWSNNPVGSSRNGPFHLISYGNFQNFGLNGKPPLVNLRTWSALLVFFVTSTLPPQRASIIELKKKSLFLSFDLCHKDRSDRSDRSDRYNVPH